MAKLEFFFDCSSPWTYLAFTGSSPSSARTGAEIVWKPILVGGVFNAVNKEVYERRANPDPRKASYNGKDLQDWARLCTDQDRQAAGLSRARGGRDALRAGGQEEGELVAFARAAFEAYWGELKDISQPDVLTEVCERVGSRRAGHSRAQRRRRNQGPPARQHRRTHRARRLRFAHHVRRWHRHVFRQ